MSPRERLQKLIEKSASIQCACKRKTVGCAILLNPHEQAQIVVERWNGPAKGHGWNGSAKGYECSGERGACGCGHAEPRALLAAQAYRTRYDIHDGSHLFCMYSPCSVCANMIVDAGFIWEVHFAHLTKHDVRGLQILEAAGISCHDYHMGGID